MTLSNSEPSSLLSPPLSGVRAEVRYSRPNTENIGYQNQSSQFRLDNIAKSYNNQYYKVIIETVGTRLLSSSLLFRFTTPD